MIYRPPETNEPPLVCDYRVVISDEWYDPFRFCDPDKTIIELRNVDNKGQDCG